MGEVLCIMIAQSLLPSQLSPLPLFHVRPVCVIRIGNILFKKETAICGVIQSTFLCTSLNFKDKFFRLMRKG